MDETRSPAPTPLRRIAGALGTSAVNRLSSFRITYVAIFVFLMLYLVTVEVTETVLASSFRDSVAEAIRVNPLEGPITSQIQDRVSSAVSDSAWVRVGRVRVDAFVLGADGRTSLFVQGRVIPPPTTSSAESWIREANQLLPASAEVVVSVPHDSVLAIGILLFYGSALMQALFFYNRAVARREQEALESALGSRDVSAERARSIQEELDRVRDRLNQVEPIERNHVEEIRQLAKEREDLSRKLEGLAARESALRASASRATELEQERQTLEELLDEAVEDLGSKEDEIHSLQDRLKRAARSGPSGGRGRAAEQLTRRLRTLYKNLEIDDRAVQDLVALRDEAMRLKAEEAIKRLVEDPDTAVVRRKVGGLPPALSIFETGFAGKGRIYHTRGRTHRVRVLAVGAKNTQKTDLEYLSRLPAD
jgi:hypothetical protein